MERDTSRCTFSALVLQNVLPYLPERKDWNNLSIASNSLYQESKQILKAITPPWPTDCKWPRDPTSPEPDTSIFGSMQQLSPSMQRKASQLDSFDPVWSRDGTQIASTTNDCWLSRRRMLIHVVDQRMGHVKTWEAHGGAVICSIDFGDNFLVSCGWDRRVKKWDCDCDYDCIGDWDHLIPP